MLLTASLLSATETIVVGNVIDEASGLPIENVNIHYKGTKIGTTTNAEGVFLLRTDNAGRATLEVSAVGYRTQQYHIEPGAQVGLQVELKQKNTVIADIFVLPGENPALELMKRVRQNSVINDISDREGYRAQMSKIQQVYLTDVSPRYLTRRLWQGAEQAAILTADSTYMIPIYQEQEEYLLEGSQKLSAGEKQTQAAALSREDFALLLSAFDDRPLDFYHQSVPILTKSFLSPLASVGNTFYDYFLVDSIDQPQKQYVVHFRPKNPYSLCLSGELVVDSFSLALRSVKARSALATVNYLKALTIEQHFDESNQLQSEQLSAIFDVAIGADSSHIFPTAMVNRELLCRQTVADTLSSSTLQRQQLTQQNIEQLSRTPIFRIARMLAHIINTGNIPTGTMVDVGNAVELLGGSPFEGFHIGLPFTTNERLMKNVELSAYLAYGFGDHAYKGRGQVKVKLPTERRNIVGMYYWDHYAPIDLSPAYYKLRENDIFYADQDFAHMVFGGIRRKGDYILPTTRRREWRLWTENDWTDNIETQFDLKIGRMGYGNPMDYHYTDIPSFRFTTLQAEMRVGFDERKVDIFMRRVHVHSRYPSLRLMLEAGSYLTADNRPLRLYARTSVVLQHTIPFAVCGRLDYSVVAGVVFGKVPYPLLEHFTGNQSYTYDPYRFTLINQMQYAADRFVYAHVHWNMQGLLFNLIPYVQRLKLRELLEFKLAWGALSDRHNTVLALPPTLSAPPKIPYIEAGIGIGNILRVADVYAVFRLTNNRTESGPFWGIRTRFALGL